MIYTKELAYRTFYFMVSNILLLSCAYSYTNTLIYIVTFPIQIISQTNYFIFTNPSDAFYFNLVIIIVASFVITLPYLIEQIVEYLAPGFFDFEKTNIFKKIKAAKFLYILLNILIFFILIPICWKFFYSYNKDTGLILFFLELSALHYLKFIFNLVLIGNALITLLLVFFFIIKTKGLLFINLKPYFILIIIIVSTLMTPPDLLSQIILFVLLYFCLEIFFLIYIIYSLYNMNIALLKKEAN